MRIVDVLRGRGGKRVTIDKVATDELRHEKIRLDQQQTKRIQRIEKIEKDKQALFERGLSEGSSQRQKILALKITELDAEAKGVQRQLQTLSHQIRILNGIMLVKQEIASTDSEQGSLISQMSLEEVTKYMEGATVASEFNRDRLLDLRNLVEEGVSVVGRETEQEDEDVQEIMNIFQRAREEAQTDETRAIEEGMKDIDQVLSKDEKELF